MFIKIQCLKLEVQCSIKRYPKPQAPRLQPQTPLAKPQAPNPKHKTPSPCSKKLINLLMNQQFLNTPIHDAKSLIHALFETIHKTKEISFFFSQKVAQEAKCRAKMTCNPRQTACLAPQLTRKAKALTNQTTVSKPWKFSCSLLKEAGLKTGWCVTLLLLLSKVNTYTES